MSLSVKYNICNLLSNFIVQDKDEQSFREINTTGDITFEVFQ